MRRAGIGYSHNMASVERENRFARRATRCRGLQGPREAHTGASPRGFPPNFKPAVEVLLPCGLYIEYVVTFAPADGRLVDSVAAGGCKPDKVMVDVSLLFFVNGLAFFATGLAIALENRRAMAAFPAGRLNFLAAWAFLGSASNFLQMLVNWQGLAASDLLLLNLAAAKSLLIAIGPILLLLFGTELVRTATGLHRLRLLPIGLVVAWLLLLLMRLPASGLGLAWMAAAETAARCLLYLPALGLSAAGMALHARRFASSGMPQIGRASAWGAAAFGLKAVVSGAIGLPSPAMDTANATGASLVWACVASVQGARTLTTVAIAWFVVRMMRLVALEQQRQLHATVQGSLQTQQEARDRVERWSVGLGRLMSAVSSATSSSNMTLTDILHVALHEVLNLTQFEAGEVFLLDGERGLLRLVTQEGMPDSMADCVRAHLAAEGKGIVAPTELEIVPSIQEAPELRGMPCQKAGFNVVVRVPLKHRGTVLGTLNLFARGERMPDADVLAVLAAVGQQVAVAVENTRLYAEMQRMAVLEERTRLSRELHDGLAQVLGYVHLKSRVLQQHLASGDVARAQAEADEIRDTAGRAYEDVRESILGLRSTITPGGGLVAALKEYIRRFSEQSGIVVNLMVSEQARVTFAPDIEVQLLRIIQEALTNARKHSGARRIWVRFECDGVTDSVVIEDDGRGFDVRAAEQQGTPHFGLQTMAERAQAAGGRLMIYSEPGQGTMVVVELPRGG